VRDLPAAALAAGGPVIPRLIALALAALAASACASANAADPTRVGIRIHYSKFDLTRIEVPRGVPITFTLVNDDPIEHEWLIGDAAFHERHRTGTEPAHGDRPDEVSLPSFATKTTTLTFERAGIYTFICHFPQHEAYGMVGVVIVKP
jgi:plastocyanin